MPEFTHLIPNFTQKCVVNASYSHAATEWLRNIYQGSPIMVRGGRPHKLFLAISHSITTGDQHITSEAILGIKFYHSSRQPGLSPELWLISFHFKPAR